MNTANSDDNGNVGVFVGCSSNGPISAKCAKSSPESKSSEPYDFSVEDNANFGVAIDLGNSESVVTDSPDDGKGTDDVFDANASCGTDLWFFNDFQHAQRDLHLLSSMLD